MDASLEPTDEQQIENLIYELATARDRADWDGAARLFQDATFTTFYPAKYPGVGNAPEDVHSREPGTHGAQTGFERTRHLFESTTKVHEGGLPFTLYLVANVIVDVESNRRTARARSYYVVFQSRLPDLALQPISAGRYHDRFVRDGAVWHFAERVIHADLSGDLRHHLAMDPLEYGRVHGDA